MHLKFVSKTRAALSPSHRTAHKPRSHAIDHSTIERSIYVTRDRWRFRNPGFMAELLGISEKRKRWGSGDSRSNLKSHSSHRYLASLKINQTKDHYYACGNTLESRYSKQWGMGRLVACGSRHAAAPPFSSNASIFPFLIIAIFVFEFESRSHMHIHKTIINCILSQLANGLFAPKIYRHIKYANCQCTKCSNSLRSTNILKCELQAVKQFAASSR